LQASIDVQKTTTSGGTLSHAVELDLKSDRSEFKWDVSSDFKEGHLQLAGALDQEAQGGRIALKLRQVPVKELLSEAYQAGFLSQELKLKSTWISCGAEWEGSLVKYEASPVAIHDCKVE